jgi:hypothetical protein
MPRLLHSHYHVLGLVRRKGSQCRGEGHYRVHLHGEPRSKPSVSLQDSCRLITSALRHSTLQFNGFYAIGFTAIGNGLYPLEILPYGLRTKGFAITGGTSLAAAFFNIYVNPIALEAM